MKTNTTIYDNVQGFSLVELMVVLTIIGVLSSIAIPVYKEYIFNAKMTELFTLLQPAKLAVTEALLFNTPLEQINTLNLGISKLENKGNVQDLSVTNGIITITGNPKSFELSSGKTLKIALMPKVEDGIILWKCAIEPNEFSKLAPANCRE